MRRQAWVVCTYTAHTRAVAVVGVVTGTASCRLPPRALPRAARRRRHQSADAGTRALAPSCVRATARPPSTSEPREPAREAERSAVQGEMQTSQQKRAVTDGRRPRRQLAWRAPRGHQRGQARPCPGGSASVCRAAAALSIYRATGSTVAMETIARGVRAQGRARTLAARCLRQARGHGTAGARTGSCCARCRAALA